jgi:hypothetical protein
VVAGTVEQSNPSTGASTFALYNGSTIVTSNLGIRDGFITGNGTVNGNLIMGLDPAQPGYGLTVPTIDPGGDGGVGTIHVTQSLRMFNGLMKIDIAGPKLNDTTYLRDRIVIDGAARFALAA